MQVANLDFQEFIIGSWIIRCKLCYDFSLSNKLKEKPYIEFT